MTTATAAVEEAALPPSTPDPQDDECVLCCYPLPNENGCRYQECCGEVICMGCIIAEERVLILGENVEKPIQGSKEEEREFMTMLLSEQTCVCPFCRTGVPENDTELLKRIWERIDEYSDPKAMYTLGVNYMEGTNGVSKNLKKAEELLKRSYDLGYPAAAFTLSVLYRDHVPDEARRLKYAEEGVRRGNVSCVNTLGVNAAQSGNLEEANRHFMTAACSGNDNAMQNLMTYYREKLLSKEDLTTALRAHKAANDAGKSEAREYASRYYDLREKTIVELRGNRSLVAE